MPRSGSAAIASSRPARRSRGHCLALLIVLCAAGCGYQLAGAALGGLQSVAIRTPENDSFEPGVQWIVADSLRRELLRRQGPVLSDDAARADLVVSGRVLPIETRAQSFSSAILAREHELTLALELWADRRDGTRLPLGISLRETERYLASADVEAQRKNRQEALRRLADVLSTRFFDAVGQAVTR